MIRSLHVAATLTVHDGALMVLLACGRGAGFALPWTFTVQGIVRDNGSGGPIGYSTTNALTIRIQ